MREPLAYGWRDRILIVGAGPAGMAAADELRRRGFTGEVTLLGDEAPYDRPACSKGLLSGHQKPADVQLPAPQAPLDLRLGRRAVLLDTDQQIVCTDTDETFEYDALIIATGAAPTTPPNWPIGQPGLHHLHTITDALAIRRDLQHAEHVAIIGGGLTGCEAACTVRALARHATIIDSKPCLMHRALGETVGTLATQAHHHAGIHTRLNRRVADITRVRGRWRLTLNDGEYLPADLVILTTGEKPDTQWLTTAGLNLDDGILCDHNLRAVGTHNIVAAGVTARWPNLRFTTTPTRCGQWIAAMEQGRHAAHTLLAGNRPTPPATLLPRFWSQQGDLRIQACGHHPPTADIAITQLRPHRKDTARSGLLATYYHHNTLTGLIAINAPHAFTTTTRALLHETPPDIIYDHGIDPAVADSINDSGTYRLISV